MTLYWLGVGLAIACIAVAVPGNSINLAPVLHVSAPASWVLGIGSILAFLAAEGCHAAFSLGEPGARAAVAATGSTEAATESVTA